MHPPLSILVEVWDRPWPSFRTDVPAFTGRLILQELPPVIEMAKTQPVPLDKRIELQPHDFFTAQPVKGARAYFLRMVLHDWSDDDCRRILGHLKDAMEPGYSRILICDCVSLERQTESRRALTELGCVGRERSMATCWS